MTMPFPRMAVRVIAANLGHRPESVGDVMVLEPGPDQYELREGYRDVAVSFGPPELHLGFGIYRRMIMTISDQIDHFDDALVVGCGECDLVLLWRLEDGAVDGRLVVGAARVVDEVQVTHSLYDERPTTYMITWSYREMVVLS